MAKVNLLDTSTNTFLDLLGNGKRYIVPPFQRDYSWGEEQWEDLWSDILTLVKDADSRHYMGALVVNGITDREFLIIDGQQRLATLSVLALVIIKRLTELAAADIDSEDNGLRALGLRNRFIGEKDPASLIESSKLFLNETDNAFYQDYLVQLRTPLNPRRLPKSNGRLWGCFKWFHGKLDAQANLKADGKALAELLNETIARQLMFILIKVDDELNAYTVFETLNARGLELSSTDLLKNYLFSLVKVPTDLEALQRRWKHLIATVKQERFPEFLRYHLLCSLPKVRSQRLFKIVREQVKDGAAVFALIKELEDRSELFSAIGDVNHEYWIDRPKSRDYIKELNLFKVSQMTPLVFAAWERFDPDDFSRVLKLLSVISFRYSVVSRLNTNELEPVYHAAAKAVLESARPTLALVFQALRPIYVLDADFEQNFVNFTIEASGQRKHLAKYILCRLENDLSRSELDYEVDSSSIEHILPLNPDQSWFQNFSEEDADRFIDRLGNMILLEPGLNRDIGNQSYMVKKQAYQKSKYGMARRIPELAPVDWTSALIENRQKQIAMRAVHLWKSDFS